MGKRIGILGGTFNPVHYGHLLAAEQVRYHLKLDTVIFIPAMIPPHKKAVSLIEARHRINMLRIAVKGNPFFEVSDIEMKHKVKSYTYDTVHTLKKIYPSDTVLYFIAGSDSALTIKTWKNYPQLLRSCKFIAVDRPGYKLTGYRKKFCNQIKIISMPLLDISSSEIRTRIRKEQSIRYLLPVKVEEYIYSNKLYTK